MLCSEHLLGCAVRCWSPSLPMSMHWTELCFFRGRANSPLLTISHAIVTCPSMSKPVCVMWYLYPPSLLCSKFFPFFLLHFCEKLLKPPSNIMGLSNNQLKTPRA